MLTDFCVWRGVLIPLALLAVGAVCLVTQTAWIPSRWGGGVLSLSGTPGLLMGIMFIAWAFGLHVRHFWGYVEAIEWWAHYVGVTAYIAAVGSGVYLLFIVAAEVLR